MELDLFQRLLMHRNLNAVAVCVILINTYHLIFLNPALSHARVFLDV
jgi:hypothetical protein